MSANEKDDPATDFSLEALSAQYPTPEPAPHSSFDGLKERIKSHYELCSDYYYSLGEHIHHGYFLAEDDTKEVAQVQLIELLLKHSRLPNDSSVLDVGCGIGGTSRFLAREHGCIVTGVTISGNQVQIARRLSAESGMTPDLAIDTSSNVGKGQVRFLELDAEKMGEYFPTKGDFDAVWISEAMSHLPNKALFFTNAFEMLKKGGKLIVADWFKAEGLSREQRDSDIRPIEDGMLLPPLCTQSEYIKHAKQAGLDVFAEPMDISRNVAKTWDISISLVQSPSLWALAFSQGRDFIAFLQAFRAMRRGYANGTFRYAVMVFERPG